MRENQPMQKFAGLLLLAGVTLAASGAAAQDFSGVRPIAQSGDWIALEHRPSITEAPDVCVAMAVSAGPVFAFRASLEGLEARVSNKKWSLPTEVKGTLTLSAGKFTKTVDIATNTSDTVSADIGPDETDEMFGAMDNASSMTVKVGKDAPFKVSLAGSTRVTNAFRTCAGLKSHAKTPGSNPFE